MLDADRHPLVKEVPGHLFQFEEKIFGMSLNQLLSDLGAGVSLFSLTSALPLVPRLAVILSLAIPLLILVHGKVQGHTLLFWVYLWLRFLTVPKRTTWQALDEGQTQGKGRTPAVQTTWIPLDTLERGIAGYSQQSGKGNATGRFWAVLEVEGRTLRYLPEAEQIRLFSRFETFLVGLDFRLQFLSQTEQISHQRSPALLAQKEALSHLAHTPRLARLQQASIRYQERHLSSCAITRHFVVVSVSAREEAARQRDGERRGILSFLFKQISHQQASALTEADLLAQLRIRLSVVTKLFQQLDVRWTLLDDVALLRQFTACLALGTDVPSFEPEVVEDESLVDAALMLAPQAARTGHTPLSRQRTQHARTRRPTSRKVIRGLHTTLRYPSASKQTRFEAGVLRLADLVAPSRMTVEPDVLSVEVNGQTRYQRYFTVTGYGHHLLCGWMDDLSELGLPMLISSTVEPIETQYMLNRLEMHLTKLESKRVADRKTERLTRADQSIEGEQVRLVARELAAKRMKIFAVQLCIGIHASSRDRLEQRTRYLLSHLRQKQLRVQAATRRHDQLWQSSLPVCAPVDVGLAVNLPSTVLSSFLHVSSGTIGTPTGVFLGFTGSGASRRPVYFHPWSPDKKIPNPHVVIVGETGMGKSFTGKTLVTGFLGQGIADVVVLDRDDDYLPMHEELGRESQRYNLARGCPLNLFDIPYGPEDVDPEDPADLLSEFLDNSLLTGLTLLVTDADTRLTKGEEAYLMHVARATYAAKGITSEAIRHAPDTLLCPMPTLADFLAMMGDTPASAEGMRQSLLERLEKASYLFTGETSVSFDTPLTILSIRELDEKWYPLMTYVVQNVLDRHRALRRDERYLAYIVEEASYMLKHPAGRRYLESGSRGFRKLGIAQFTLSQHPRDFLEEGQVILSNAGTAFFLGMQRNAASKLDLSPELERTLTEAVPGQVVMRCGNEYAALSIASIPAHRAIFTTDPAERRALRQRQQAQRSRLPEASETR